MIDTTALFGAKTAELASSTGETPLAGEGFAAMLDGLLGAVAQSAAGPFGVAVVAGEPQRDEPVARILGFVPRRGGADAAGEDEPDDGAMAPPGVAVPVVDVLRFLSGDPRTSAPAGGGR